jgi:hypothetical protein
VIHTSRPVYSPVPKESLRMRYWRALICAERGACFSEWKKSLEKFHFWEKGLLNYVNTRRTMVAKFEQNWFLYYLLFPLHISMMRGFLRKKLLFEIYMNATNCYCGRQTLSFYIWKTTISLAMNTKRFSGSRFTINHIFMWIHPLQHSGIWP